MAVARQDLGGEVLALQSEPLHHPRLDRGWNRGVGADRAGELADRRAGRRRGEAGEVAVGLECKAGEAQAEGGRLGVDAVGAADAERLALLERPFDQGVAIGSRAGEHDLTRLAKLQRKGGIKHVGGGEPKMDPAAVLADRPGEDVHKCGDVMVGNPLALCDRLDGKGGARPCCRSGLRGNDPLRSPRLGRRQLDLKPALHLSLRAPDLAHLRPGVAGNHQQLMIRAARTPAFLAPSIATQATGIPGGI